MRLGFRRVLAGSKRGLPLLIATYGLGLILAGIFHPDPGYGFPPGTGAPVGMLPTMSSHATIHSIGFLIVVLSLVVACFAFFSRFRSRGQNGWGIYSAAMGIVAPILVAVGINTNTIPLITLMAVLTFGWLSAVAARLHAEFKDVSR